MLYVERSFGTMKIEMILNGPCVVTMMKKKKLKKEFVMTNNDGWYNREYDRYTGYLDQPTETLKQKKIREEFSSVQQCGVYEAYPDVKQKVEVAPKKTPEEEAEEVLEQLKEIHSQLDDFSENLRKAEGSLKDISDFLDKVGRNNED